MGSLLDGLLNAPNVLTYSGASTLSTTAGATLKISPPSMILKRSGQFLCQATIQQGGSIPMTWQWYGLLGAEGPAYTASGSTVTSVTHLSTTHVPDRPGTTISFSLNGAPTGSSLVTVPASEIVIIEQ